MTISKGAKILIGIILSAVLIITVTVVLTRPVDCKVSDWSEWSYCDKTCGTGEQTRIRNILTLPKRGGKTCPELTEYKSCKIIECPIDCQFGEWGPWSKCDKNCGKGIKKSERSIIIPAQYGGKCKGDLTKIEPCNDISCNVLYPSPQVIKQYFDIFLEEKFTKLGERYFFNVDNIILMDPRFTTTSEAQLIFGDKKFNVIYILGTDKIFIQRIGSLTSIDILNFGNIIKLGLAGLNQGDYTVELRADKYYGYSISEIIVL